MCVPDDTLIACIHTYVAMFTRQQSSGLLCLLEQVRSNHRGAREQLKELPDSCGDEIQAVIQTQTWLQKIAANFKALQVLIDTLCILMSI